MKSFLLRFEEKSAQATTGPENRSARVAAVAGTQTLTEVRAEGVDKDPHAGDLFAFPR
jgi:hypothetical protein